MFWKDLLFGKVNLEAEMELDWRAREDCGEARGSSRGGDGSGRRSRKNEPERRFTDTAESILLLAHLGGKLGWQHHTEVLSMGEKEKSDIF